MLFQLIIECADYDFQVSLEQQKPKSWLKSVSAFANGVGGSIFYGIDDNKNLIGIDDSKYLCNKISELVNSRISPIPKYILTPYHEEGKVFVELKIFPGPSTPYFYFSDAGREAYIRSGNQSIVAPTHILEELILKGQNKTYDSIPTKYRKDDYSFTFFEATFLEKTFSRITDNDYISFSLKDKNGYLTNAGVLLADQNIYMHNRVFCTHWNGLNKTSLEEASDDDEYSGGLVKLLDSSLGFVKKNTKKRWKKTPSGRVEMPEYDETAIREAIVNALIHRQYTNVGSEVTIDIYDDRITITSPGPTASGIIIKGEINEEVPSIRRNPILADIFARMKFMDRRGSGFDKIKNGTNALFNDGENHVEFYATKTHFAVTIYNANYQNTTKNATKNATKNMTNQNVLKLIKQNPNITVEEMAKMLDKNRSTIIRNINTLKEDGLIEREGSNRNGSWKILYQSKI